MPKTVRAIYDNGKILFKEGVPYGKFEVIVTFLNEFKKEEKKRKWF
jgi:predicted DNA-binding antitoxin AbrB/MazE fold protein